VLAVLTVESLDSDGTQLCPSIPHSCTQSHALTALKPQSHGDMTLSRLYYTVQRPVVCTCVHGLAIKATVMWNVQSVSVDRKPSYIQTDSTLTVSYVYL